MTLPVWPYAQRAELIESLEWQTDVIRARAAEQRIALRSAPRTSLALQHLLPGDQLTEARELLRAHDVFAVPDWPRVARVGNVAGGAGVAVTVPVGMGLQAGDEALLWRSPRLWERVTVSAATDSSVTITTVVDAMSDARLLPLRRGIAPQGVAVQRFAGGINVAQVAFELSDTRDVGASTYEQYRGHDVLPMAPVVGNDAVDDATAWPLELIDNATAVPVPLRTRTQPDERTAMRWHVFGRPAAWALRQWLHSRKGRQRAFWLSTWARDFELAATIGAADTVISVRRFPALATLRAGFDVEIRTTAGAVYRRQVGTPAVSGANWQIPIGAALGASVTAAQLARISMLRCLRFDADRIELLHRAGAGMAVSVPCIEVLP